MKRLFVLTLLAISAATTIQADDWMARLDDNTYVTQLSIPGTHDAATGDGFPTDYADLGEAFGRTQQLTIAQQWQAGIRAFDLRPAVADNSVIIRHGIIDTQLTFAAAINLICDSLRQHPTEFAIVIMRHEDDGEDDTQRQQWSARISDILAADDVAPFIAPFSRDATIATLRGHILVLSRNTYEAQRGGIISGWSHSPSTSDQRNATITQERGSAKARLFCQDFYDCSAEGAVTTKTKTVRSMLDYSTKQHKASTNAFTWIINHTSGYSLTTWGVSSSDGYRDNAATQNAAVIQYLADPAHYGPTGIIMMDYAGTDRSGDYDVMGQTLTEAIIENNFRYTPKTKPTTAIRHLSFVTRDSSFVTRHSSFVNNTVYDLSGRRVNINKPATSSIRRIYVSNGKKFVTQK